MDDLRDWQKILRKNKNGKWNKPTELKIDTSGIEYARRKKVTVIYVDTDSGEIMQFGANKCLELLKIQWDGMFPYRKMEAIYTSEYEKFIESLKNKQV